ncbi:MAG: purine-nucleoside phosphorylase [Ureaplasma sp.]|nr:purine-nucleoside phosphorylase [Ureaplasma sp.]
MTPHISAKKNEIAKVVIMPGDPLRAKWIAENYLKDCKLVSSVRNMLCFTGTYKGIEVTVMGHGMGIGSIGIYSYELYNFYDVETIIRIGSAGSYVKEINVLDVLLVDSAFSESPYAKLIGLEDNEIINAPTIELNNTISKTAKELNIDLKTVRCHSSDVFYSARTFEECQKISNSQVVEMEVYALFANAIKLNKKAAALLTCSDSFITKESLEPIQRQKSFSGMVELALETLKNI